MQRARVMHENRLISRVNLPLLTLIVHKAKISERFIMRSWPWRMGHRKRNGNKKERKCDNRNVAET